jgi:surfeit locus 1 family protein
LKRIAALLLAAMLVAAFAALGSWQLQRRIWKLALIEQVNARVDAAPGDAPIEFDAGRDAYRRVQVDGRFDIAAQTLVQAVTERGAGFWVLTPLHREGASTVLVNRGFVAAADRDHVTPVPEQTRIVGLLRASEPGGGFLRRNDPAANRWYSRDVAAIAAARRLRNAAPYFIDAEASAGADRASGTAPVGGLTVIAFSNNHLVYAITWFTLALMSAAAGWRVMREEPHDPQR